MQQVRQPAHRPNEASMRNVLSPTEPSSAIHESPWATQQPIPHSSLAEGKSSRTRTRQPPMPTLQQPTRPHCAPPQRSKHRARPTQLRQPRNPMPTLPRTRTRSTTTTKQIGGRVTHTQTGTSVLGFHLFFTRATAHRSLTGVCDVN